MHVIDDDRTEALVRPLSARRRSAKAIPALCGVGSVCAAPAIEERATGLCHPQSSEEVGRGETTDIP
jgi:hypothetical protein